MEELAPVKVSPSETAELICTVSSDEAKVKWFCGDEEIVVDDEKYKMKKAQRRHSLIITDITAEDAGEYKCAVGEKLTATILTVTSGIEGSVIWLEIVSVCRRVHS